jgi:citrate synthase
MTKDAWKTALTDVLPDEIRVRGYPIEQLMGHIDLGPAVYLMLRGELPSDPLGRVMTAILVACIDHGPSAPSVLAARNAAATGAPLNACVAAGVLAINRHHGGAIEDCAIALRDVVDRAREGRTTMAEAARAVFADCVQRGQRVAGFGHLLHRADPRTGRLFALAADAGLRGPYVEACEAMESVIAEHTGGKRPINADGAIAAILCEMGFEPDVMNGLFILSRTVGLIAQAREEMTREKPLRRIDPAAAEYDGPPPRQM